MTENLYTPDCIRTFSGQYVNVFEPDPATILIEDIAHALSHQCRFGGHLSTFYTVAQHCCNTIPWVSPESSLAALMHDASEAYLMDIPSPIKRRLANYHEIEDRLMRVIANKFGFQWPLAEEVKLADKALLELEWQILVLGKNIQGFQIYPSSYAKTKFLMEFENIKQ